MGSAGAAALAGIVPALADQKRVPASDAKLRTLLDRIFADRLAENPEGATALGLFVAVPAVWMYNYFLNKIERFNVEMSNSASELIDFFIKKHGGAHAVGIRQ